jgi:hypothetical protein
MKTFLVSRFSSLVSSVSDVEGRQGLSLLQSWAFSVTRTQGSAALHPGLSSSTPLAYGFVAPRQLLKKNHSCQKLPPNPTGCWAKFWYAFGLRPI